MTNHYLVVLFQLVVSSIATTILSPESIAGNVDTPTLNGGDFLVNGTVVVGSPRDGCSPFENADEIAGNIVLVFEDGCVPLEKVKFAHKANATGVLVGRISDNLGPGVLAHYHNGKHYDLPTPAVELPSSEAGAIRKALDNEEVVVITITPGDDPYDELPWWLISVVVMGFCVLNGVLAVIGLYKVIMFKATWIPFVCLVFELIACVVRGVWAVDPLFAHKVYPYAVQNMLVTMSFPFTLSVHLLIAFVWDRAMRSARVGVRAPSLKNVKYFAFCISAVIIVLDFIQSLGRALYWLQEGNVMSAIGGLMYFLITLVASTYFLYTGIRVVKILSNHTSVQQQEHSKTAVRKLAKLIIASGVAGVGFMSFALMALTPFYNTVTGAFTVNMTTMFCMNVMSFTHILVFWNPAAGEASHSSDISKESHSKQEQQYSMELP